MLKVKAEESPVKFNTLKDLIAIAGDAHQSSGLHVINCVHESIAQYHFPFRSDNYFVFVVTGGLLHMRLNLLDCSIGKDNVLVVAPSVVKQFVEVSLDFSMTGIIFTPGFWGDTGITKKYIEPFDFFAANATPNWQLTAADAATLVHQIQQLHQKVLAAEVQLFSSEILQHLFSAFMYELAAMHHKYGAEFKVKMTRKEDMLIRFMKLLPEHFKEERSVQFYADLLYVTPKYLSQTAKEIIGKTAGELIDQMVITEAKILLADLSSSIAQVADSLYFSDQFFFSKYFKNQTGITPSKYRMSV